MADSNKEAKGTNKGSKQPFVSREDRPEVRINLDTPLNELRVRELSAILGFLAGKNPNFEVGKTSLKDFFDKDFPEVAKDWVKEVKSEKFEKNEKHEIKEIKEGKEGKEVKEVKAEKLEIDGAFYPTDLGSRSDPRMEQVIQVITGLTKHVSQLANQVEELRKKALG